MFLSFNYSESLHHCHGRSKVPCNMFENGQLLQNTCIKTCHWLWYFNNCLWAYKRVEDPIFESDIIIWHTFKKLIKICVYQVWQYLVRYCPTCRRPNTAKYRNGPLLSADSLMFLNSFGKLPLLCLINNFVVGDELN